MASTAVSRSTACTSGSATTTTRFGSCARSTTSSTAPTTDPGLPDRDLARRVRARRTRGRRRTASADDWSHWVATFGQQRRRSPAQPARPGGLCPSRRSSAGAFGLLLDFSGVDRRRARPRRPASCSAARRSRRALAAPRPAGRDRRAAAPGRDRGAWSAPWRRSGCSTPRCRAAGRLRRRCSPTSRACATTWPRGCAANTTAAGPAEVADLVDHLPAGRHPRRAAAAPRRLRRHRRPRLPRVARGPRCAIRDRWTRPLVRGMYDLVFAYEDGDPRRPRFAAGLGLFLAGKLFFEYRGSIFWRHARRAAATSSSRPSTRRCERAACGSRSCIASTSLHVADDGGSIQAVSRGPAGAAG